MTQVQGIPVFTPASMVQQQAQRRRRRSLRRCWDRALAARRSRLKRRRQWQRCGGGGDDDDDCDDDCDDVSQQQQQQQQRGADVRGGSHPQRVSGAGASPADVERLKVQYVISFSFVQQIGRTREPKELEHREDDAERDAHAVHARRNETGEKRDK
jgi:hypothetical protein